VRRRRGDGMRGGGLGRTGRQGESSHDAPGSVRQTRWRWRVLGVRAWCGVLVTLGRAGGGGDFAGLPGGREHRLQSRPESPGSAGAPGLAGWGCRLRRSALWLAAGRGGVEILQRARSWQRS
jgi:hypothetical protein